MTQLPPEAYPYAVYSSNRRATPDQMRVESTETSICMWIDGLMIGVSRTESDTRLQGALNTSLHLSQAAERFGSLVRAELERRERTRQSEPIEAAMRAAAHATHPADALAVTDEP